MAEPWILIPLGNPGPEYAGTRHNLGRLLLQRWLEGRELRAELLQRFSTGTLYRLTPCLQALVPATYMNLSGQVCAEALRAGIDPSRLVVLLDDKDLPLGTGRLRLKGKAHGHNGLESVLQHLGTEDIARLRLGIGPFLRPLHAFVLGAWTPEEEATIRGMEAPFAAFLELLSHTGELGSATGRVNPEAFWRPPAGTEAGTA